MAHCRQVATCTATLSSGQRKSLRVTSSDKNAINPGFKFQPPRLGPGLGRSRLVIEPRSHLCVLVPWRAPGSCRPTGLLQPSDAGISGWAYGDRPGLSPSMRVSRLGPLQPGMCHFNEIDDQTCSISDSPAIGRLRYGRTTGGQKARGAEKLPLACFAGISTSVS